MVEEKKSKKIFEEKSEILVEDYSETFLFGHEFNQICELGVRKKIGKIGSLKKKNFRNLKNGEKFENLKKMKNLKIGENFMNFEKMRNLKNVYYLCFPLWHRKVKKLIRFKKKIMRLFEERCPDLTPFIKFTNPNKYCLKICKIDFSKKNSKNQNFEKNQKNQFLKIFKISIKKNLKNL